MTTATAPASRWYFGPVPDLLLGCGLAYAVFFVAMSVAGPSIREVLPIGLLPLGILLTGVPHYGATLLRVYEHRKNRRAYAFFSVFASALVWGAFVVSLYSPVFGSLLLTVYLTWSPYHYTGQNYGITLMFLRRRDVPVSPLARRLIHASFLLSFALTALAIHSMAVSADYAPVQYESTVYRLMPLGIPDSIANWAMLAVGGSYLASSIGAGLLLLRVGSLRDLAPAGLLVLTQALWFSVPVVGRQLGCFAQADALSLEHAAYTLLWIGMGHSLQYLWVTTYYATQSGDAPRRSVYLGKTLLAGAAIWVVPGLVFAPGGISSLPYDAGLAVMIATAVNLQHFILDGAIWKLRDGRIARILIRGDRSANTMPGEASGRVRIAPFVWAAGALSLVVYVVGAVELHVANEALLRRDLPALERAGIWLARVGRPSAQLAGNSALLMAAQGDLEAATARAEDGVALHESAEGRRRLAYLYELSGRREDAVTSYRRALELEPDSAEAQNNLAWLLATSTSASAADSAEAVALAQRAARTLDGQSANALDTLAVAYAADGRFEEAVRSATQALKLARRDGDPQRAEAIGRRLRMFRTRRPFQPES